MSTTGILIGIISVIVALSAFYFSAQSARATARAGIHAVDADAYKRASEIYENTISNLRSDITSLREDIGLCRAEIRLLRSSNDRMSTELRRLGKTIEDNHSS